MPRPRPGCPPLSSLLRWLLAGARATAAPLGIRQWAPVLQLGGGGGAERLRELGQLLVLGPTGWLELHPGPLVLPAASTKASPSIQAALWWSEG